MFNTEYTQIIKNFIQNNSNNINNNNKQQKKSSDHQIFTEFFFENQQESQETFTDLFSQKSEKLTFPHILSNKNPSLFQNQQTQQMQFQLTENDCTINNSNNNIENNKNEPFNINGNSNALDKQQSSFVFNSNLCNARKSSFELEFTQNPEEVNKYQKDVQNSSFLDQQQQDLEENRDIYTPIFEEEINYFNFNNTQNIEISSNSTDFNSNFVEFSLSTPSQNQIFSIQNAKNSNQKQKQAQKCDYFDEIFPFLAEEKPVCASESGPFKIMTKSKKIGKKSGIQNKKEEQKNNSKNYDKNICKYLTRTTIRAFHSLKYFEKVMEFCNQDQDLYSEATQYFIRNLENISGLRVLKSFLNFQDEPDFEIQEYKKIFRKFYKWFLKNRITRYILKGKMEDKEMYIQYKNNVMLKYSEKLEKWNCNKFKQLQ